ncbi:thioredoxin family protein [Pseudomonas sp. Marseille-QA0892]
MPFVREYISDQPTQADIDALSGSTVLEFGTQWCGYCQGAQRAIEEAMSGYPDVRHIKVEDGKGRPLGRGYKVKLWPTLIFLKDGIEQARAVRPARVDEVSQGLERIR